MIPVSESPKSGQTSTYPLTVHAHATPVELGSHAGADAAQVLRDAMQRSRPARVLLAAAPSQRETLRVLAAATSIDFSAVEFFHMDDYIGLPPGAPQGFANWLEREFLETLPAPPAFHRMNMSGTPDEAARRYAGLLGDRPFDLVLCGLGVNAHIAFNDPGCDFADSEPVRAVQMDTASRQQQVDEGHFEELFDVPTHALTLTVPRVLHAEHIICSVPGAAKRAAVRATLEREPTPDVPGTALKLAAHVHLYLDDASDPR